MNFNQSITFAMARRLQDLSDFVFVTIATLIRHDSYLAHLKSGIKPHTVTALRNPLLHSASLLPDSIIPKAEDKFSQYEDKHYSASFHMKLACYHTYAQSSKTTQDIGRNSGPPAWISWPEQKGSWQGLQLFMRPDKAHSLLINDNYCIAQRGVVKPEGQKHLYLMPDL